MVLQDNTHFHSSQEKDAAGDRMLRGASLSVLGSPPPSPAPSLHGSLSQPSLPVPAPPPAVPTEAQVLACEEEVNSILSGLVGVQVLKKNGFVYLIESSPPLLDLSPLE